MRLARYRAGGTVALGRVDGDHVEDLLVDDGCGGDDLIVRHLRGEGAPGESRRLDAVTLLAPVVRPQKILCIGLNYRDHCRESGMAEPEKPLLFAKYPNAIIGPDEPICFDPADSSQVDFEAELVAVIGTRCHRVSAERALGHVAGYTVGNDVSARDAQFADSQWVRGKTFDTFCPLGPWITTADELPDPQQLGIRCWVGDRLFQDSSTAEMIFPVAELVSYLSRYITLEPGDLVLTGTPWGVGFARTPPVYLSDGDTVRIAIEGIGELANPVRTVT